MLGNLARALGNSRLRVLGQSRLNLGNATEDWRITRHWIACPLEDTHCLHEDAGSFPRRAGEKNATTAVAESFSPPCQLSPVVDQIDARTIVAGLIRPLHRHALPIDAKAPRQEVAIGLMAGGVDPGHQSRQSL